MAPHPGIFQKDLLLIIMDLCRYLPYNHVYSHLRHTFGEKLDFTTTNHIKESMNLLWT